MDFAKTVGTLLSLDLETHLIQPGLLAPPIVCGSYADVNGSALLSKGEALSRFMHGLSGNATITGANIAFDFGCVAVAEPDLLEAIFAKYECGQVYDVLIAQTLDAIARGLLRDDTGKKMLVDPRTGGPVKHPVTGKLAHRYSLEVVTDLVLNRVDAKRNDAYRKSYATLEHVPMDQWPEEARQYPVDDAVNTRDVAVSQLRHHRNLHDMPNQAYAAWCLHLGSIWGLRADPTRVGELRKKVEKKHAEAIEQFTLQGYLTAEGKENSKKLKLAVIQAYAGPPAVCPTCVGGKVPSPKTGNPINCKACDGTSVVLDERIPRTDGGGIKTDRDTLAESGDDALKAYAEFGPNNKIRETYLPFLEAATKTPVNVSPNVLVSTGRTSYDGKIQTIPRAGGVRECFIPSKGRVISSVDYSAIEMCTLAEVMYELLGFSKIGDVINESKDPGRLHSDLGARLAGREGDPTFYAAVKIKGSFEEDMRQSGKAGNFGFPGMMGEVKFVHAKRKEGLRVCQLTRRAERCGRQKVTEWRGREYTPTCLDCIQASRWIRTEYLNMWNMQPYFNKVQFLLDSGDGEITQLVSERVRGGCSAPQAANTFFQGLAADGAKRALRLITRESYCDRNSPLFGSRLLAFAHDETLMEHHEEVAHEAAHRQSELMIKGMKEVVKRGHVVAEPALMRFWSKKAEAKYNEKGRLIPWEDQK